MYPNKVDGHDQIRIRMLKMYYTSVYKPSVIFSSSMFGDWYFSNFYAKKSILFSYRKNVIKKPWKTTFQFHYFCLWKKLLRNLSSVMFNIFIESDLISSNQCGFKLGDLCVKQHLSLTYRFSRYFDSGYEVKGIFLDRWKVLCKIWHDGINFKLEENCKSGHWHMNLQCLWDNQESMFNHSFIVH